MPREVPPPTSVYEQTFLLGMPLTCSSAAETAILPLIWCSESLSVQGSYFLEVFFHRHRCEFMRMPPECPAARMRLSHRWRARIRCLGERKHTQRNLVQYNTTAFHNITCHSLTQYMVYYIITSYQTP